MKTTLIWFPKHGDSMEFEVEYHEDEAYAIGFSVESVKLHGIEMFDYLNESAIEEIEDLLVEKLK